MKKNFRKMLYPLMGMIVGVVLCCFVASCSGESQSERYVKTTVDEVEARCPMRIDELTILEHFVMRDDLVAYQYVVDDDLTVQDEKGFKTSMSRRLKAGDEQMLAFFGEVVKTGRGLAYEYRDAAGHKLNVVFSNKELGDIVAAGE